MSEVPLQRPHTPGSHRVWFQHHPEAGSSWPSWPQASCCSVENAGSPQNVKAFQSETRQQVVSSGKSFRVGIWAPRAPQEARL
jgi:hypothetical protein